MFFCCQQLNVFRESPDIDSYVCEVRILSASVITENGHLKEDYHFYE